MAWFHAQPSPLGHQGVGVGLDLRGRSGRPACRARTRATLVSTTATSRSKAKASTARAVYGPMPGRASSASRSIGQAAAVPVDDHAPAHGAG